MSQGSFSLTRYEASFGSFIMPIRVQPETLTFTAGGNANAAPAGNPTLNLFARARKNSQQYGVGARYVTISWDADPPTGYEDDNLNVPIMQESVWAGYAVGDSGTYLATACTIVGKTQERAK